MPVKVTFTAILNVITYLNPLKGKILGKLKGKEMWPAYKCFLKGSI